MVSILFVCTGNICRSPLAEGILKKKLREQGIAAHVDSCGFESYHVGDPPDHRAQEVARMHGIDISSHRGRLFTVRDFDRFDRIYVMDSGHFRSVSRVARNESDRMKADYILNILYPEQNRPVMDPWYHDAEAFREVFHLLDEACSALAENLHQTEVHGKG